MTFSERLQRMCFGPDDDPDWALKTWTNIGLLIAVFIGILLIKFHGGIVSAGIACYTASLGVGGVLGFLFGVPAAGRVQLIPANTTPAQQNQPGGSTPLTQEASSAVSTTTSGGSNLEQVADWVTKLLLGGGLTQLTRIPPKVWQWSRMVALGIIGNDKNITEQAIEAQQAFAAGILVYGFILGFFGGFLITKLQLKKSISN